jgi:hypothetical protein
MERTFFVGVVTMMHGVGTSGHGRTGTNQSGF